MAVKGRSLRTAVVVLLAALTCGLSTAAPCPPPRHCVPSLRPRRCSHRARRRATLALAAPTPPTAPSPPAAPSPPLRRYALRVAYDGTDFSGWQRQDGDVRSVQRVVEEALRQRLNEARFAPPTSRSVVWRRRRLKHGGADGEGGGASSARTAERAAYPRAHHSDIQTHMPAPFAPSLRSPPAPGPSPLPPHHCCRHGCDQPSLRVAGASRTDAGVHARGQVVQFRGPAASLSTVRVRQLQRGANTLLPRTLRLRRMQRAPPGFNAQRDCVSKVYSYRLLLAAVEDPLLAGVQLHWCARAVLPNDYQLRDGYASR